MDFLVGPPFKELKFSLTRIMIHMVFVSTHYGMKTKRSTLSIY